MEQNMAGEYTCQEGKRTTASNKTTPARQLPVYTEEKT